MAKVRLRPETQTLYFDFFFEGSRCREYTTLQDTAANRKRMDRVATKISAEIKSGEFRYEQYFPTSKKAKELSRQRQAQFLPKMASAHSIDSAVITPPRSASFSQIANQWRANKQVEWRISYKVTVESILDAHLLPYFGERPIASITRQDVLGFRTHLAALRHCAKPASGIEGKPLSPSTINRITGILRMIMEEGAIQFQFTNPCLTVKRLKEPRSDIEPFSMDEMQRILSTVREDYRPYLTFRFLTGVRSAEAHGLKWKHIDVERREVLIRETFQSGRTESTKTDGSQREIHMSQPVLEALQLMMPSGYPDDPKSFDERYVFATRNGLPIDNKNFNERVWKPLLRLLGLKYRRPYQMRHTCATLWLAAGESPEWIARQLGHTTTEMLFRTYSRYVPNLVRRDGRAFDTLVTGIVNQGLEAANDSDPIQSRLKHLKKGGQS
jgi:integrase